MPGHIEPALANKPMKLTVACGASHGVTQAEAEQVFFNVPLLLAPDREHSQSEDRYYALGVTNSGRALFVVFTVRGEHVRVISARDMSRRERRAYEQAKEG